jgi:hypothetical protein
MRTNRLTYTLWLNKVAEALTEFVLTQEKP